MKRIKFKEIKMTFKQFIKKINFKNVHLRQIEETFYGHTSLSYNRPHSPNENSAIYKRWVCGGKERRRKRS